jgi:phage terminase small subunit
MRGRPAKPTRLKVAEGNPGKRKLNQKELKEKNRAPICPRWLSHDAQLKWKALCKVLSRRKLIREEDQMNLAAICHAWATEKAAIIALSKLSGRRAALRQGRQDLCRQPAAADHPAKPGADLQAGRPLRL